MQLRKVWKWLGLAGVAGVAATGVVIARNQRQRTEMTPDDVRTRLHERLREGSGTPSGGERPASGA